MVSNEIIRALYDSPESGPKSWGRRIDHLLQGRACPLRWGNYEAEWIFYQISLGGIVRIENIVEDLIKKRLEGVFDNGKKFH